MSACKFTALLAGSPDTWVAEYTDRKREVVHAVQACEQENSASNVQRLAAALRALDDHVLGWVS